MSERREEIIREYLGDAALRPYTAWEEARHGNAARLIRVYCKTIARARDLKLLPRAIVFGLRDQFEDGHRCMVVAHDGIKGSGFFAAELFAPSRDGRYGFSIMPPPYFKEALRQFMAPPPEETRH